MGVKLLTTIEAAKMLGQSDATLRNWRCKRIGPDFVVISARNVRYREEDIQRYVEERVRTALKADREVRSVSLSR